MFNFAQGTTTSNPFWDKVRDFLSEPTQAEIDCQSPKPILLNTGKSRYCGTIVQKAHSIISQTLFIYIKIQVTSRSLTSGTLRLCPSRSSDWATCSSCLCPES